MKNRSIRYGYAEKRSYDFQSIEVCIQVEADLDEGEKASDALSVLRDQVQQRVIADADEALAALVTRVAAAKAGK